MAFLDRLLRRGPKDPYWDRFLNGPLNDPLNDASEAYRNAPPGDPFPVKTEVPDAPRMARDLAQFAVFMGASTFAVAETDPDFLRRKDAADGPGAIAEEFTYTLVFTVPADVDPDRAHGMGGQQPRRISALVDHAIALSRLSAR